MSTPDDAPDAPVARETRVLMERAVLKVRGVNRTEEAAEALRTAVCATVNEQVGGGDLASLAERLGALEKTRADLAWIDESVRDDLLARLTRLEAEQDDFCALTDRLEALVVLAEKQAEPPQSPAERRTGEELLEVMRETWAPAAPALPVEGGREAGGVGDLLDDFAAAVRRHGRSPGAIERCGVKLARAALLRALPAEGSVGTESVYELLLGVRSHLVHTSFSRPLSEHEAAIVQHAEKLINAEEIERGRPVVEAMRAALGRPPAPASVGTAPEEVPCDHAGAAEWVGSQVNSEGAAGRCTRCGARLYWPGEGGPSMPASVGTVTNSSAEKSHTVAGGTYTIACTRCAMRFEPSDLAVEHVCLGTAPASVGTAWTEGDSERLRLIRARARVQTIIMAIDDRAWLLARLERDEAPASLVSMAERKLRETPEGDASQSRVGSAGEAPAVGTEAVAWRWKYRSRPGMDWSLARMDPGTSERLRVQPLGVIGPAESYDDTREPGAPIGRLVGEDAYDRLIDEKFAAHALLTAAGVPEGTLGERILELRLQRDRKHAKYGGGDPLADVDAELARQGFPWTEDANPSFVERIRLLAQRGPEGERLEGTLWSAGYDHPNVVAVIAVALKSLPWLRGEAPLNARVVVYIVPPEGRAEGGRDGDARVGATVDSADRGDQPDVLGSRVAPPASAQAGAGEDVRRFRVVVEGDVYEYVLRGEHWVPERPTPTVEVGSTPALPVPEEGR